MSAGDQQPSKTLRTVSIVLQCVAILAAFLVGGFVALILVALVFYFLGPRSSVRRARIGIAISIIVGALLALVLYSQVQLMKRAAELAAQWEGTESPPFSFVTIDGQEIQSGHLLGKRVLLNFWATWCAPCRMEIPEINRLFNAAGNSDVAVFGLSFENRSTVREFLEETPIDYPLVSVPKGRLPRPYNQVIAVPTSFVIDRNGVIQFIKTGYIGADELKAMVWDAEDYQGVAESLPDAEGG